MFGRPSLRRRFLLSYLAVVLAVTLTGFVTVQVLVPQFFEQGVQQRLGPGGPTNGNQNQGNTEAPGGGPRRTTTTSGNDDGDTGPPQTTSGPGATSSTRAPTTTTEAPGTTRGPGSTQGPGPTQPPGPTQGPGGPGNGHGGDDSGSGSDSGGRGGATEPGDSGTGGPGTTVDAIGWAAPGVVAAPADSRQTERSPVPVEIQQEYDRALTRGLIVAAIIGLALALGLGYLLTRRLLGTLNEVNDGARRLAEGHYDTRVDEPREAELADLAQSVNTLADSLERTAQTRARLVSDLAHEIRNPLSTIEGYMEGLIDGVMPPSRDTYEAVAREAHRLQRLTRDLSTLSKAQEGAIEYTFEDVDLADIVRTVIDTLEPQYEVNEVALRIDVAEALPIKGDADRLAQALTNLLGNALAHTPPGGQVAVTGVARDGHCTLAITDTGNGIPEDQLETIFERFTRLDREQPGTGIGLNIARTLVRDHDGDVVASSPGAGLGSTFTVRLPSR